MMKVKFDSEDPGPVNVFLEVALVESPFSTDGVKY
jgi:hypothetical protein